jgi:glutathione S-transferase
VTLATAADVPTLLTFAISHYSEKVRWGLDLAKVPYRERRLVPGPHVFTVKRLARRSHVPVLIHGDVVVQGSGAILDYAVERLGAHRLRAKGEHSEKLKQLEEWVDSEIGRPVQTVVYSKILPYPRIVTELWYRECNWLEQRLYSLLFPFIANKVRRMYRLDLVADATRRFAAAWEVLEAHLLAGRYFDADRPGRFDVTVAALLAPICRPPEHVLKWPESPPELAAFTSEFEGRPLATFIRDLYRNARR